MTKRERMKLEKIEERIASGEIINQKSWKYIVEMNSYSAEQLDKVALIDTDRKYTYRQMFRNWEYYAEVFSALNITGENQSRVGLVSGIGVEPIHALYALDMTGATVSAVPFFAAMNEGVLEDMIKEEGITDLIVSDAVSAVLGSVALFPIVFKKLLSKKEELGLRNIILQHVPIKGPFTEKRMELEARWVYDQLREIPDAVFMEDLLEQYEATPIIYDKSESKEDFLILHTSGTTKGIPKPVPFSDRQVNAAVDRFFHMDMTKGFRGNAVTTLMMELAASYGFFDELHLPLAFGGTVVVHPQGYMNPLITKAIGYYRMNIIFTGPPIIDLLSKLPPESQPDLSSLKLCAVGGGYLSEERKKKFNDYIKERGGNIRVTNGYGLTEAGAACILSDPERDDDAIGFPMPGISVKIFDEDEKKFYSIEDGPRTGGLFIACDTISSGRIGDKVFFETEEIDGRPYLCTFDLVRVNEDGSLTSMGRMNRFFVNDEGVRFESGIVENAMAARSGISECAVLPEYSKTVHDTVPVLYVKTQASGVTGLRKVREAVRHLFINDDHISSMNLPEAVVIAEEIPYNANGKVDVHEILKGSVKGDRYLIKPIYRRDKLKDILLVPPNKNKAGFGAVKMMEEFTKKNKEKK